MVGYPKSWWSGNRAAAFSRYGAAIPRVTTLPDIGNNEAGNFSVETILSLRPDVVILPEVWSSALKEQIAKIEQVGIPVLIIDYNAQTPERHAASTLALGAVSGNTTRARELAELYTARVADIQRRAAGVGKRPRVLYRTRPGRRRCDWQ